MIEDPRAWLAETAEGRLRAVVRVVLGEPGAELGEWNAASVLGGAGVFAGSKWLYLLTGTARAGAVERPWSLVLKVYAPVASQDDPSHIFYWKREPLLLDSGFLDDVPVGLRAPRCYGCDEQSNGHVWLWMEHVKDDGERVWPLARWALTVRHLGQFNGAFLAARLIPRAPWLGGRRLRAWLARHERLVELIAEAPHNPAVRRWWPRPIVDRILGFWRERHVYCAALERLPQTFCHGDAIRRNLLVRRRADGTEETVGVDWEFAGYYAVGEEVGQTLSVASAFSDVDPSDLPTLDEALFDSYLAGLRDAGWQGEPRRVRFAYVAHAAFRNLFNAVGASVPDEAGRDAAIQRYGHTWEELAERRAEIRPFLLERANEARELLAIL